jgi:hypothetical protein
MAKTSKNEAFSMWTSILGQIIDFYPQIQSTHMLFLVLQFLDWVQQVDICVHLFPCLGVGIGEILWYYVHHVINSINRYTASLTTFDIYIIHVKYFMLGPLL